MYNFTLYENKLLNEINVTWSRNYKNHEVSYLMASMQEGEEIYNGLMKYIAKHQDTTVTIDKLPISTHLKKKYKGVKVSLTYNILTPGLIYNKVNTFDKFSNPEKYEKYKNIRELDPQINVFTFRKSTTTNNYINRSIGRDQFMSNWVEFKRELRDNVLYKKVTERISTEVAYNMTKGYITAGVGAAFTGALSYLFNLPLTWAATVAAPIAIATGFHFERAEIKWFANDPLEVEKDAIDVITDRVRWERWSPEYFTKHNMGPNPIPKEEFIKKTYILLTLSKHVNFLTEKNLKHFFDILYDAYVLTLKGKLYTKTVSIKEAIEKKSVIDMWIELFKDMANEISKDPTSANSMKIYYLILCVVAILSIPITIVHNIIAYKLRISKIQAQAILDRQQKKFDAFPAKKKAAFMKKADTIIKSL